VKSVANKFLLLTFICASFIASSQKKPTASVYYPEANQWKRKSPADVGLSNDKLQEAIAFAKEKESKNPRNLEISHYQSFGREPFGDGIGPFKERGPASGLIIRNGYVIASWGEPERVDMTFSVTKSFVSTLVGLAYEDKLIPNINDTVYKVMAPV
jgi:hypothetical protein